MGSSTAPRRVLLIRPSALGDVCRSVPVLVSLARALPEARVDWLVRDDFAPAIAAHPDLGEAIPFPRRRFAAWWRRPGVARELLGWLGDLRRRRYDLVLDAQGLGRSGLFALATGAPERHGYADASELGWMGLNRRHRISRDLHAVDRMLALTRASGAPPIPDLRLYVSSEDRAGTDARLRGVDRVGVIAPTSRWPGKRWPADRFAQVSETLVSEGLLDRVAIVGAASERAQVRPLLDLGARDDRIIDLVGRTSVGTLMATIADAALVIANDSAALHMGVGFGRPLVGLFGPTRIDRVGPYGREADVIQRISPGERLEHKDEAGGRALMERIGVSDVLERAEASLAAGPVRMAPPAPASAGAGS